MLTSPLPILTGRVVKSVKNVSSVNVSDLTDGMYTVTMRDSETVFQTERFLLPNKFKA